MTNKEFYNAVINQNITDEVIEKAKTLLEKTELSNSSKNRKRAEENAPLIEKLKEYLIGKDALTASEIAKDLEMTTSKVVALARNIENIEYGETKVNGRKVKTYKIGD